MSESLPKILVVDDTLANRVALRRLLAKVEAEVTEAGSGNEALAACLEQDFALILLDVNMPEMDGFEVAGFLGEEASTRDIPIIFVSASYSDLNQLRGYGSGAVDYIAKPINEVILLSKVQVFLDLYRSRAQLKTTLQQLHERNRQLEVEIGERQRAEQAARHQATHDVLTGLPNRALFMDRLQFAIERYRRRPIPFALAYVDIDEFKPVNDLYGHQVGDQLLVAIARRMREHVRSADTVARLGGDEFAVVMEEAADTAAAVQRLVATLCERLRQPYQLEIEDKPFIVEIGSSVGIALFPQHGQDCDTLIRSADRAMYAAKRGGKNRFLMADQ
ncbi:MAG: diguanylate cyclase protein [Nevskia sp.]|nr:diguanylate cyclase protein [Nevskia sp.]